MEETATFDLPGPDFEICAVCSGVKTDPPCVKCGGKGTTRARHVYVVTKHMMSEGLALMDDLMTAAGVGSATETVSTFANSVTSKIAKDMTLAGKILSQTTRDGAPIDIAATYRGNYSEYYSVLMRVCDINGFFGPPGSI